MLREAGRNDEAEHVIASAISRFPDELLLRIGAGWVAEARHDWKAALERWDFVSAHFQHITGAIGAARALENLGCPNDAVERLVIERRRHPTELEIGHWIRRLERQLADRSNPPDELKNAMFALAKKIQRSSRA